MKTCRVCGEEKPLDEYHKNKGNKDGHLNACKKCVLQQSKEYRSENRDKILEYKKEYYSRPENKDRRSEYMKDYFSKPENKDREKSRQLQKKYGITLDEYNQMFTDQNGCCAVCGKHESNQVRSLAVDHDHETGEVRELLCTSCNTSLGLLQENEEILLSMLAYIRRHK